MPASPLWPCGAVLMTASYRKASSCTRRRNRKQEGRINTRFWPVGVHSDVMPKKRSEVAAARRPPMVFAPGKRMGCCCFGASPSMRIVASWFGSNGSTEYKDVAAGFLNRRQLESGLHLVSLCFSKSRYLPPPPESWGWSGVGRSPLNRQYECHEKRKHHELALYFKRPI